MTEGSSLGSRDQINDDGTVLSILDTYLIAAAALLQDDRIRGNRRAAVIAWVDELLDGRNLLNEDML